jgi:hypothetical protein
MTFLLAYESACIAMSLCTELPTLTKQFKQSFNYFKHLFTFAASNYVIQRKTGTDH